MPTSLQPMSPQLPTAAAPPSNQASNDVVLTMPREIFEAAKNFVTNLKHVLDAADARMKAELKGASAQDNLTSILAGAGNLPAPTSPEAAGLEDFAAELQAADANRFGGK